MRRWAWAVIIGGVITVVVAWRVAATSGPRYDREGLPTGPVGVAYVTHVPEYRLAYPGARILSVYNNGEEHYDPFPTELTLSASSQVTSQAPATQRQVFVWYTSWLTRHGWTPCTRCSSPASSPDMGGYFTRGLRRVFSVDVGQEGPGKHANFPQSRVAVLIKTVDFVRPYSSHLAPYR